MERVVRGGVYEVVLHRTGNLDKALKMDPTTAPQHENMLDTYVPGKGAPRASPLHY